MIPFIKPQILQAAKLFGVELVEVGSAQVEIIRDRLVRRYAADQRYDLTAANLADRASVQHPDSWQWIGEFVGHESVYLFFNPHDEAAMFLIPDGAEVVRLLGECSGFVFFVSNQDLEYVLCQDDHDYLIGVGAARQWVESLRPRHLEWAASLRAPPDRD